MNLPSDRYLRRIDRISDPEDYFSGISGPLQVPPHDVLLFTRTQEGLNSFKDIHHRSMLVICLTGEGDMILEENFFHLSPGEGLLVFPHQSHYYANFEKADIKWLFITFELNDGSWLLPLRDRPVTLGNRDWEQVTAIVACYQAWQAGQWLKAGEIVPRLWLLLSSLLGGQAAQVPPATPSGQIAVVGAAVGRRALVRRVTEYVYRQIHRPIPLSELAHHLALSESHLRRCFRESLGLSLGDFIAATRINKACSLLRGSTLNVSEIAFACGFTSLYAFSRAFRRRMGCPPLKYRHGARQKKD